MYKKPITRDSVLKFKKRMLSEEKSMATVEKYIHDINCFFEFVKNRKIDKAIIIDYKSSLINRYAVSSANSMLAALNSFFKFLGRDDFVIKQFKVQKKIFCSEEKELTKGEYFRLIKAAKNMKNERLSMIIQTICATGIRVSELQFITVEGVKKGSVAVRCKGKSRRVFIVKELQKKLLFYIKSKGIKGGCVFVTKGGKPINRCNIWREMKNLCKEANVSPEKVFPHNLRHLFARTFYRIEKDIAKLADILGHSNINTTRIYIISTGEEHRARMENMRLLI